MVGITCVPWQNDTADFQIALATRGLRGFGRNAADFMLHTYLGEVV